MAHVLDKPVPGEFASSFSMSSFKDIENLANHLVDYLSELKEKYKSSVFKIHPGLKTVVCLDHVSAEFYFSAPQTILEREERPRFGPFAVRPEMLGGSCPTLVASGKTHDDARALTDEILQQRRAYLEPAFEKVSERILNKCRLSSDIPLWDLIIEWASNIGCNWLYDIDVDGIKAKTWLDNSTTIDTDSILAGVFGKVILPKCPRLSIETQKEMKELLEQSPLFPGYKELAQKHKVPTESLSGFLTFLALFNISGAVTFSLYYTISKIYSMPELKSLIKEQLMGADTHEILQNPLLDNIFFEVLRLNAVPRIYYKKAQCDFSMPVANGDTYAIRKGDLVLVPPTMSHRDPTVFENPDIFDPTRFDVDPSLKEKVFGFGVANQAKNSYGCAAKHQEATWVWKKLFAKFITNIDFEFKEEPTFDFNANRNLYPLNIAIENIVTTGQSAKEYLDNPGLEVDSNLKKQFSKFANKVRNKEVEFDKKGYLKLYGLYKQALNGDNSDSAPSRLKVLASEKWISWNRLKGLSKAEAMVRYIEFSSGEKVQSPKVVDIAQASKSKQDQQCEIIVTHNFDGHSQLAKANFYIHAEKPDVVSGLELELILYGDRAECGPIKVCLPNKINSKMLKWSTDIPLIGAPQVVDLSIKPSSPDDFGSWLIEKIELRLEEVDLSYQFLHNTSINIPSSNNILFEATGILPKDETAAQKKARECYIEQKRQIYKWKIDRGLPGVAGFEDFGELPLDEQFQAKTFSAKTAKTADIIAKEESPSSFEEYDEKIKRIDRPIPRLAKHKRWMKDEEFGRLYLQGTHCNFIQRCSRLPEVLNINTNFNVARIGRTLKSLIDDGLLYICDYEMLADTSSPEGRFLAAPIVLFYSDIDSQDLYPVAIQIERDEAAPIFTPDDAPNDWLFAKMWARVADISVHQLHSHFVLTHAVLEAFAVSVHRTLSPVHPLYQLLIPHFKHTLCINTLARNFLINDGGWIDRFFSFGEPVKRYVMQQSYKKTSLKNYMNLPRDLKSRGVDNTGTLPNYAYRDDGILVWEAIETYVQNIIGIYYKCDADVDEDICIKTWLNEFKTVGYIYSDWGEMNTLDELKDLLVSILFSATAIHGSMNFMQYEVYGYVPNSPPVLYRSPPRKKGATSIEDVLSALPGSETSQIFIFLSQMFDEDIKLAGNDFIYSNHPDFRRYFLQFKKDLERIEKVISQRNRERKVPYISMLPSNIPNSVDL